MFESTSKVLLLDYFRVPYTLRAEPRNQCCSVADSTLVVERLVASTSGRAVLWPKLAEDERDRGQWSIGGSTFFGQVLPDDVTREWLHVQSPSWSPRLPIR